MAAGLVGALALSGSSLAGCVSTQRKNARAELVAARTLAARTPLRLRARSRDVRIVDVALVRGRRGGALVVALRNRAAQPRTDVPIAVGVRAADGRRTPLDGGRGLDWFQTHVPAIGAGETTTWVYTTRRALPDGRPYAIAGAASEPLARHAAGTLPAIAARVVPAGDGARPRGRSRRRAGGPATVRVALVNRSDVPQYDVQVYAVVRDGGRVLAAGSAAVGHLGARGRAAVRVALVGAPGRHPVRVHALPTIFE
jgi:hypothetical protein